MGTNPACVPSNRVSGNMGEVPFRDLDLVRRACGGDGEAFGLLVERYQDYIYNAVVHLVGAGQDAEDLTQETFLKAYRSITGFRRKAQFSTWLYGIMLNCVRSHWRKAGRHGEVTSLSPGAADQDPLPEPPASGEEPLAGVTRRETVELVRRSIGGLPEDLREVIVLRDLQGMSYEELADCLGLPLGTVKSRLFRARSALKDRIAPFVAEGL